MGDVTRQAPESLREYGLAALLCTAARSVPIHHLSGISQGVMRNVHSWGNKKKRRENGKIQLHQMWTPLREFVNTLEMHRGCQIGRPVSEAAKLFATLCVKLD